MVLTQHELGHTDHTDHTDHAAHTDQVYICPTCQI